MTVDKTGCLGTTIKTASGLYFDLAQPWLSKVSEVDIATALSHICRFGGHIPRFYSVAEHCIHCERAATLDGHNRQVRLAVLLHDAAEAYVGDMVKPLKQLLPRYREIEDAIEQHIRNTLGGRADPEIIKHYDHILLKTEKLALFPDDREQWLGFDAIDEIPNWQPRFWEPRQARDQFLQVFHLLARCERCGSKRIHGEGGRQYCSSCGAERIK